VLHPLSAGSGCAQCWPGVTSQLHSNVCAGKPFTGAQWFETLCQGFGFTPTPNLGFKPPSSCAHRTALGAAWWATGHHAFLTTMCATHQCDCCNSVVSLFIALFLHQRACAVVCCLCMACMPCQWCCLVQRLTTRLSAAVLVALWQNGTKKGTAGQCGSAPACIEEGCCCTIVNPNARVLLSNVAVALSCTAGLLLVCSQLGHVLSNVTD